MSKYPFSWYGFDEDPKGKYKQPTANTDPIAYKNAQGQSSGYPQDDIDMDGVMVKGRWPSDTKKKTRMKMQGTGAATKGTKFYPGD